MTYESVKKGKSVEIKKPYQLRSVVLRKTLLSKNDEIENSTFLTIFCQIWGKIRYNDKNIELFPL